MKYLKIVLALIILSSCSSDDNEVKDYTAENDEEIQAFIADNNLVAQKSNSGLYYVIDNPGTGDNPLLTDRVKVSYKGYYTNGTVFDESTVGVSFFLENVISGWAEGIAYFKEGGSGKLLIPSHLAYGSNDYRGIPGGSVLIFDIELIYVNYVTENDEQIQTYIADNGLIAQKTSSGLYYTINSIGEGPQVKTTDNVSITYVGYLIDGNVFDQTTESTNFNVETLIAGFSEGLTYINEGGSGTLLIPSHLAYGKNDYLGIPGGSVLIFDVELISIN
jgi:FKBP-type peptidyl-prolyl cis-trans isomerase